MKFSDDETVRPSIERRNLDGRATIDVSARTRADSEFRGAGREGANLRALGADRRNE